MSQTSMTEPTGATKPPSRATLTASHLGYQISATASRRVTGALLVNAELSGGPDRIRRWFCVASEATDLIAACEGCIAELCKIIDDISSRAGR